MELLKVLGIIVAFVILCHVVDAIKGRGKCCKRIYYGQHDGSGVMKSLKCGLEGSKKIEGKWRCEHHLDVEADQWID